MAAIIVASVPIWGMSWYFDTENWAAGIWNSWAAQRTDTWREAMVRAVVASGQTTLDGRGFMVAPEGLDGSAPFSFVVIGDTGEGDAEPAGAARLADSRRGGRRRAIRRAVVRCRVSHGGDARLRARDSGCRSRASRNRCMRSRAITTGTTRSKASWRRSSSPTPRGWRCGRASTQTEACRARRMPSSRISSGRPTSCAASTACPRDSSRPRSSRCRRRASSCWRWTPVCCAAWTARSWRGFGPRSTRRAGRW